MADFQPPKRGPNRFKNRGGGNSVTNSLQLLMAKQIQNDRAKENVSKNIQDKKSEFKGALPPGSSETISDSPSLTVKTPDFSLDESRAISSAGAFSKHSSTIRNYMDTLPRNQFETIFKKATARLSGGGEKGNIRGFPTTFGDKDAQKMNFAIKDMEDRLLRLRSGAAINQQEFSRLSSLLPSYTDISDPSDVDYSVIRNKLSTFENELSNIKKNLTNSSTYNPDDWGDEDSQPKQSNQNNDPLGIFS